MREVDPSNLRGGAPARFNTCPPPPSFYTQQCSCDASLQTNHPPTPPPQRAEHKSCLGSGNHLGPSGCEQSKGRAGAYLGPSLRSCLLWGLGAIREAWAGAEAPSSSNSHTGIFCVES